MNERNNKTLWLRRGALLLLLPAFLNGQLPGAPASAQERESRVDRTNEAASTAADELLAGTSAVAQDTAAAPKRPLGERVNIGGSLKVREDETVGEAVTVFGSSDVAGKVTREMVTVFGNSVMSGIVDREMVTVFGKSRMTGSVGREMVTVFGDAEVDGSVGRECVAVFGNLKLGPNAKVGQECVAVFGSVERHPDAELDQEPVSVLPMFSGLGEWITDGLMMGRLLPPGSRIAWIIVVLHLLLYGLLALLLPRPVQSCVGQLDARPLLSFGVGLLSMILLTPLYLILAATGVGVVLIPFIGLGETIAICLGKTATLEYFGFQIFRGFGRKSDQAPLGAFMVGFLLVTLLYMVPLLGLLLWMILRPVALGAAVLACISALRRNGNGYAPGVPMPPMQPSPGLHPPSTQGQAAQASPETVTESPTHGEQPPTSFAVSPMSVSVMPRAGFWIRLVATGLDFIALSWILMLPWVDSFFVFFWIAYHIGMWAWKGTTIGGIVCNLKVVRLDGRDADVSVCLVRGLASIFSALPLLLGFFWVGWTAERQSWHDKIAGTVIVRVPRGISLI
jgi:uncharacterized RDD family membrane protein YckC